MLLFEVFSLSMPEIRFHRLDCNSAPKKKEQEKIHLLSMVIQKYQHSERKKINLHLNQEHHSAVNQRLDVLFLCTYIAQLALGISQVWE